MKLRPNLAPVLQLATSPSRRVIFFLIAGLLASGAAMAEKPDGVGRGKPDKYEKPDKQGKQGKQAQKYEQKAAKRQLGEEVRVGGYFVDSQRTVVRTYYTEQYRVGRCPPGLAKKNNGCLPPGQARKWAVGQPLPRELIYYSVPTAVIVQLGAPPAGHRYVRVATDILLIAIGTGMVIDAIQDLGGM